MTTSYLHERLEALLALLVSVIGEECNIAVGSAGGTTLKRRLAERGLEPDASFYAANLEAVRGKNQINLAVDPPPDLAIEVDVTHSSLDRMGIYAGLKVPEVWRWVGGAIRVYQLNSDGMYDESDQSTAFLPGFPVNEFLPFLEIGRTQNDGAMMRAFRRWLQQWIADHGLTT